MQSLRMLLARLPHSSVKRAPACNFGSDESALLGTTRDCFGGKRVVRLEYEGYTPMAEKELLKICKKVRIFFPLAAMLISSTGTSKVGFDQHSSDSSAWQGRGKAAICPGNRGKPPAQMEAAAKPRRFFEGGAGKTPEATAQKTGSRGCARGQGCARFLGPAAAKKKGPAMRKWMESASRWPRRPRRPKWA